MEIVAKENEVTILDHGSSKITKKFVADPMTIPRAMSEKWRPQLVQDLPEVFCGGGVFVLLHPCCFILSLLGSKHVLFIINL